MAGLQPEQVLSISKKYSAQLATNYATGFDHATAVNNADGSITLTIFFKNGTSVQGKISGVQGVGIVDVEFRSVDGKTHLFCIMSDATEIDAGEVSPRRRKLASPSQPPHLVRSGLFSTTWILNTGNLGFTSKILTEILSMEILTQ